MKTTAICGLMFRQLARSTADLQQGAADRVRALFGGVSDPALWQNMLAVGDQAIVSATGFLTMVLLGRHATPQQLGLYALASSVLLLIKSVQESIVLAPYTVYWHRQERALLWSYAGSTLVQQVLLCAVAVGGLGLAGLSAERRAVEMAPVFWVLLVVAPAVLMREFARQVAFAHLEIGVATVLDLTVAVMQVGGLSLLAAFDRLSAVSVYWTTGVACGLAAAAWTRARRSQFAIRPELLGRHLHQNWTFGKWILGGQSVSSLTFYVMPWLLAVYHGTDATGLLAACSSVVGLSNMLMLGVGRVLGPRAAKAYVEGGQRELGRVLLRYAALLSAILGVFALVFSLFGGVIAVFIYGQQYARTGAVIAVLALSMLAASFGMSPGYGLWALDRAAMTFRADVLGVSITIAAAVYLVPHYSTLGAAAAMLAGTFVGSVLRGYSLLTTLEIQSGAHG